MPQNRMDNEGAPIEHGPVPATPIRVWRAALDRPDDETRALGALLAADERARAERFRFERDRRRYSVGRGLLRRVLGQLLEVAPEAIVLSYGTRGKPALAHPEGSGLEFNLTHSHGMALFAATWRRAVGIDIEHERPDFAFLGIANRFFTPGECQQITGQPEPEQRAAFFRGWARKEAFLKARGDGLWIGLDKFAVTIDPALPARVDWTAWDPGEARRWSLRDLDAQPGYAAALAVDGLLPGSLVIESL